MNLIKKYEPEITTVDGSTITLRLCNTKKEAETLMGEHDFWFGVINEVYVKGGEKLA